jgi:type IV secretion system protein VirB9
LIRSVLIAAVALLVAAPAAAQVRPQPGEGDRRLQTVEYAPNQVVVLEVATGYQLTVELAPDEQIENVAVGDSGAWQVTANRRGDRLFIKPLQGGVSTNMTVITNARVYAMDLVPLFSPSPEMAYTVRYRYPEAAEEETADATEPALEGRYRLSGDRQLRPSRIGDDGTHTVIEWPREATLPAVYGVDSAGNERLLNGMMRDDDVFVIDGIATNLVFRRDRQTARARRVPQRTAS